MAKLQKITQVRLTVVGILLVAALLFLFDLPLVFDKSADYLNSKMGTSFPHFKNVPFVLGLDLQGGSQLVYNADVSKIPSSQKSDAVEGVRDVIERRVNAFGVSEPVVQINRNQDSWRVIVELAGIKDVDQAIKMIGDTPLLEFKEQNLDAPRELNAEEQKSLDSFNKDAKSQAEKALAEAKKESDFSKVVNQFAADDAAKKDGGDLGWINSTGVYSALFTKAEKAKIGQVFPEVVSGSNSLYVMKVNEKRDTEKEVQANHLLICFKGATGCTQEISKEDALKRIKELKLTATAVNFVELVKTNSTEPGANETGGDLGWFKKGNMVKEFEDAAFSMTKGSISDPVETAFGYHLIYKADERPLVEYKVSAIAFKTKSKTDILPPNEPWKGTGLTGSELKTSSVQFDPNTNIPTVALEFNDKGKQLFADITARNVGKPVAIFLDGEIISSPRVNEAIKEGKAVISGDFDITEAKTLSRRLNAGALPVPINLLSQQTVGASLGNESLQKSLFAGLIGLLLVALFMIAYYRFPGFLAVLALSVYCIIVLAMFKMIPVTLTLAGIAGFVLSIGMAVDANVLIFERLKEELKMGKPLGTAINEAFKRAWPSIRDGNYSTLITCFILFWFGSSVIKGFAVTLTIGVIMSMFSALIITKVLMQMFINPNKERKSLWWYGVKK